MKIQLPSLLRRAAGLAVPVAALVLSAAVSPLGAQRLPGGITPEHYRLWLAPDLKAATFSGVETIDLAIERPTATITLNAAEIAFQSVSVKSGGREQAGRVTLDREREQATFTFPARLPAGRASLEIHYTGVLNGELRGFYLSKTARRNYAVTQFEPTDARRAFPSFDEPAFKASYEISLTIDRGDTAISNTPIAEVTPGPGAERHTIRFRPTPRMSTYLVAFLVGDFECTEGSQDGVAIRVCSTPEKVALTRYGVGIARDVLHYYNGYFGIPYPLPKLDLIALPDFEAGAMENFGAITYRETDLLLDPGTASPDSRKNVALVIAHEMAHQWFGDLVTMQWWDNIWLNEGFATWMESKAVGVIHPEWRVGQQVAADMDRTLNTDAQPTTRAIRARADTPDEINQMFDGIAYGKAGSVLLSVENYLGEETFRRGVHNYLAAHLYGNATAEDFWSQMTAASQRPVDRIMSSLVAQPGVPLITLADPGEGSVGVSQGRFFLSPAVRPERAQRWTLPVCFKAGEGQQCELLAPGSTSLKVPPGSLMFANAGGKGYYRLSYPSGVYRRLVDRVESDLTPEERISLIGNEWAGVRANKVQVGEFLDLVAAVRDDPNAEVIGTATQGIGSIALLIARTAEEKEAFAAWVRGTFHDSYARLGPPRAEDPEERRELRGRLFYLLGTYGNDPDLVRDARRITESYLSNPGSVEPSLRQAALSVAARHGDAVLFDRFQRIYETEVNPELQESALNRLTEFEDPALVKRALEYAVSGRVRNQDSIYQLAQALRSDRNREQTWRFIQDNWDRVQAQFTVETGGVLVNSTGYFCSAEDRASVEQFFAGHKVPASDSSLRHAVEAINGCIELRSLQEPRLRGWLDARPKS